MIIPPWLFQEHRKICFRLPFCESNEKDVKHFIEILEKFTNGKFQFIILWTTRKIKSLFPIKDKIIHKACAIYRGQCSCGSVYIGETERNVKVRWDEHEDVRKKSEPSKHLYEFSDHSFTWRILAPAPRHWKRRKILEAFFITKYKPDLNDQVSHSSLSIFRNGIT